MASLQQLLSSLTEFWNGRGCVQLPPLDVEVAAGILAPDVFLRLAGDRRWWGAQFLAAQRPWDGRGGENALRLVRRHLYQVLLKPPPDDTQDLLLTSLAAIGIRLNVHDVRFCDVESRIRLLDVRGVGWSVRMDGIEVGHVMYLKEAAGRQLEPVAADLSYDLDRLALLQQGANTLAAVEWGSGLSYSDVCGEAEGELYRYYYEVAEVETLLSQMERLESEARACLDQDLVRPAYHSVLRAFHVLKVLNERGALGLLEEPERVAGLRQLAGACSERYLALQGQPSEAARA